MPGGGHDERGWQGWERVKNGEEIGRALGDGESEGGGDEKLGADRERERGEKERSNGWR